MVKKLFVVLMACMMLVTIIFSGSVSAAEVKICQAVKGTIVVDGQVDDAWNNAKDIGAFNFTQDSIQDSGSQIKVKTMWDDNYFYALFEVTDKVLSASSQNAWEQDSVEIFIDPLNKKAPKYSDPDGKLVSQYRVNIENVQSGGGAWASNKPTSAVVKGEAGYIVEIAIPWADKTNVKVGGVIGVDFQFNDDGDASGKRTGQKTWSDTTNNGWQNASVFGVCELIDAPAPVEVAPAQEAVPSKEAVPKDSQNPKTGDTDTYMLYAVMLFTAGGVLFTQIRKFAFSKK